MRVVRSTFISLKFANTAKRERIRQYLDEWARCCNSYIDLFWAEDTRHGDLLKPVVDKVQSDSLGYSARQSCAREAVGMIVATRKGKHPNRKPRHNGKCMRLSQNQIKLSGERGVFDFWIKIGMGEGRTLKLPCRKHKHFNDLAIRGELQKSYLVSANKIQVSFKIDTGAKRMARTAIGCDTGIQVLATISDGRKVGTEFRNKLDRVQRCKHGSKGQKKAVRTLKEYINLAAKEVVGCSDVLVVENLKGITFNLRRRLGKKTRRLLCRWQIRHWFRRLELLCQDRKVSFRRVSARYTSQTCHRCGHVEQRNRRNRDYFECRSCGYGGCADYNAAQNILARFLAGPYGAGCKGST